MTKRLMVALLCAVGLFALGGVGTAEAKTLSYGQAKVLAKRLAQKQVRGRGVVSFHLLHPTRVGAKQIVFSYDDRTKDSVYCRALVVVKSTTRGRSTRIRARFTKVRCNGIPSEMLRFEALTRRAQRDLRANTAATVDALDAVRRSARACRNVRVPKSKTDEAQSLFDIALVEALEGPNDAAVGNFVAALVDADVSNPTLAAGASAWADYLATVRELPPVDNPCALLKEWRNAGFASGSAPIDFAAARALDRRANRDSDTIARAASLMARRGVFPNAAVGFTTDGLLLQGGARVGITGGSTKAKAVLG